MSENQSITAGQNVYSRDGHKYLVREVLSKDRLLVSEYLLQQGWDGDEEEYPSDLAAVMTVADMYPKAPTSILDADISSARDTLAALQKQLVAERNAINEIQKERIDVEKRLASAPKFSRLMDYLDGKITHFVCSEYQKRFAIKTWAELAVYQEDRRNKGVKLLTLFGDSKGNTEWRINTYRDGSGINVTVIPCESEAEAKKVVGEQLESAWGEFKPTHPWFLSGAIASAREYGFPIPAEIEEAEKNYKKEQHLRAIQKAKDDLASAVERYANAEKEWSV